MFMDTTKTFPTISGMPIRVSINGTAMLRMQSEGKMDFARLLRPSPDNQGFDVEMRMKPR